MSKPKAISKEYKQLTEELTQTFEDITATLELKLVVWDA